MCSAGDWVSSGMYEIVGVACRVVGVVSRIVGVASRIVMSIISSLECVFFHCRYAAAMCGDGANDCGVSVCVGSGLSM